MSLKMFPKWGLLYMPKNREKTRANKIKEKQIEMVNAYGINNPTPYEAIKASKATTGFTNKERW